MNVNGDKKSKKLVMRKILEKYDLNKLPQFIQENQR